MEQTDVSIFRFTPVFKDRVINTEFFVTPTQMEKGKEREREEKTPNKPKQTINKQN